MLRGRRIGSTVLTTFVALVVTAGCGIVAGSDSDTDSVAGTDAGIDTDTDTGSVSGDDSVGGSGLIGPQLNVRFDLTGAITLKGKQTALATSNNGTLLKSCDEYVKGSESDGKNYLVLPGILSGPVDGKKVTLENLIVDYTGPGDYPKDQLVARGNRPTIMIDNTIYSTWPDSTESKVGIDANGGGRWTIKKLATTAEGGLPGDAIEGTVMWTCSNP